MIKREQIMAKPFLKWAGGKKWFVNQERDRLLLDFNRYKMRPKTVPWTKSQVYLGYS